MGSTKTHQPFIFPFESAYVLNSDFDFADINPGTPLPYAKDRVINFTVTTLVIGVQSEGQKEYKVTFKISRQSLQISCNCKTAPFILCAHSFYAFHELCWINKAFFKIFEPGNRVSIALKNKSIFHTDYSRPDEFIVPDKSLGHLYDFKMIEPYDLHQLSALPAAVNNEENKILAWLLVYSSHRWQSFVPFLVPIAGVPDKAGNFIKSFGKGFENISAKTLDDRQLQRLSETMYAQTRKENNWEFSDLLNGDNYISENYNHWKQAVPLLAGRQFVYKFRLAKARYFMKQAPRKSYLQKISIATERPQIQFVLKDKGNYYQLSVLLHHLILVFIIRNE
jgi:hypothetical protein